MTMRAFRELARAGAIAKAHEYCNGAPDDRGPAVFFPLHLDIEVDNSPLEISSAAPALMGDGGAGAAAGGAAQQMAEAGAAA
jgi:predicted naringenin-chalcone synthase